MTAGRGETLALLCACTLLFALPATPSLAQNAGGGAIVAVPGQFGVDELMQALRERRQAQARFTETKYLRLLSQPLHLSGTLSFRAPDRMEKRTLRPNVEILLVEGDRVTIEVPQRRLKRSFPVREHPALWGFVESLRATLAGDRATLQRFYEIELRGGAHAWELRLAPSDPAMRAVIAGIRIAGADASLREVEIVEARGDRSVLTIREGGS